MRCVAPRAQDGISVRMDRHHLVYKGQDRVMGGTCGFRTKFVCAESLDQLSHLSLKHSIFIINPRECFQKLRDSFLN